MKTTLVVDDTLFAQAKAFAALNRTTLTALVNEGLRMRLAARGVPQKRKVKSRLIKRADAPFPVFVPDGPGGLLPGIDPCSNKSLLDACDGYL